MKKIIAYIILIAAFAYCAYGSVSVSDINLGTVGPEQQLVKLLRNKITAINEAIDEARSGVTLGPSSSIFYVDATNGSDSYSGTSWKAAFATIDTAIGSCTANAGDIIYVAQNSDETKSTTGALITADIAGVTIIGCGTGPERPTLTLSHTGAKIDITADGVIFYNFIIDATGVDSVNTPINLSGVGSFIVGCDVRVGDTVGQADLCVTVGVADGDANDAGIIGCSFFSNTAGAASAITFAKDMTNFIIADCTIYGDYSTAGIEIPTGGNAQVNLMIDNCRIISKNADEPALEVNGTGNTGFVTNSLLASDAEATIVDAGGLTIDASTRLVVLGTGEGAPLPANTTLVDLIGDYTGPDDGAAADDNIKAHLDLIKTTVDALSNADITGNNLDHLMKTAVANGDDLTAEIVDGTAWSNILTKTGDTSDYARATMSFEAMLDNFTTIINGVINGTGAALPSNKSLFDIIGETYTDDGGADHLDDVASHINLVLKYLADGTGGGAQVGASLPAGKSLFDIIGDEYTDDGGNDNLDSVAAHLNLLSKYVADGDGDFATGSALPSNKSLYDLLGAYTGDGGADDEDTIMAHLDLIYGVSKQQEQCISKTISTIANGNNDLFAVTGGPIKLIDIVGYVTTQIGAESCKINYNIDPTTPETDTAFATDGDPLECNADAVGTLYTWNGVIATDLTATTNGVALGNAAMSGLIIPAGSIEMTATHDGTCDGAITVYMRYIPLSTSSVVTAAP